MNINCLVYSISKIPALQYVPDQAVHALYDCLLMVTVSVEKTSKAVERAITLAP
jgi:hypothetical protein